MTASSTLWSVALRVNVATDTPAFLAATSDDPTLLVLGGDKAAPFTALGSGL